MAEVERFSLAAPDGIALASYRWLGDAPPRAIVQIAHGRGEHALRYGRFAADCVRAGLAVYASDHRGHGQTAAPGELGDFGPGGFAGLAADMALLTYRVRQEHPGVPVILMGHSMGSFAAQLYIRDHVELLAGSILSGSAALDFRYAESAAPVDYNACFQPQRTPYDWLSRDEAEVDAYLADPLCGFALHPASQASMVAAAPQMTLAGSLNELPVLLLSGDHDPVNANLRWFQPLVDRYVAAGAMVTIQVYPGGRHEMLNEINRDEVTSALIAWITTVAPR
ncbi:MAG: alpha/beta fold hydrolase [Acetobacteraceae bacterium]|nr:alpha/beta fold hydrolase [Acetobacteraceae bacterium]